MDSSKKKISDQKPATEVNAAGNPLPSSWIATIAIIWCGQAISIFATVAASFAAIWYITESTSSAVWLSLASMAALLPVAILSPFGGVAADRYNRKHIVLLADGSAGFFSLVLALVVMSGHLSVPLMLLLLAVRTGGQAFHGPAMTALMPHLVPKRHLMRINSMDQSITSLSTIVGPALGILLYTYVGLHGVMLLDAFCAAIACLCLASVKVKANISPNNNHDSVFAELREGATFIYKDKGLRSLMLLIMFTMLLFMPVASLDPLMVYEHFKGDGFQASLVEAVFGIGLLIGSAVILVWGGGTKRIPLVIVSGIVLGLALAACGFLQSDQFPLFAVLVGVTAAAIGFYNAPIMPILQNKAPDEKFGRVM
ncbi:putative uncharacterized protein [Eggerthella sp. CAG:1427]|nr:putative uncharacterized protein [Eggerthella sp. CAG:1427]